MQYLKISVEGNRFAFQLGKNLKHVEAEASPIVILNSQGLFLQEILGGAGFFIRRELPALLGVVLSCDCKNCCLDCHFEIIAGGDA